MIIETSRLILRRPEPKDETRAVDFWASERAQYTGGGEGRMKGWRQFAHMVGHWSLRDFGLWTVTAKGDDTALGMVGPYFPEGWPETEVGWVLFEGAEGKGIAFEAAQAAIADSRGRLGWTTIVHYISHGNDRSVALAKRLGATEDHAAKTPGDKPCHVFRQPEVA